MQLTRSKIPGHHFPPLIISAVAAYLTTVFTQTRTFGRPLTLKEAFPRLLGGEAQEDADHDGHEPALYEDERAVFKTVVFGIPNWREPELSYLTIAINILMAILTLDLVFRAPLLHPEKDLRFSRVGFVDGTSARVLFREPDPAQLPIYAYLKGSHESKWSTTDQIYYIDSDSDFTHPITFAGLVPDTTYTYSLSNDLSGTFTTAPGPRSQRAESLTFLTSSCIKANFPYRPFSHSLAIHGFEHLSTILRSLPSPASFMLFIGDFVYIDVPLRLSSTIQHYRSEYRRVYASPSWSLPGISSLPWLHTLDDHEIANDWSGGNETEPFPSASDPFLHYHVSVNPPIPPTAPKTSNTTYFQFTRGPAEFFMLDTRRYRTDPEPRTQPAAGANKPLYGSPSSHPSNPPPADTQHQHKHTILGPDQLASLLLFLSTPPPPHVHFKLIASSVPFTKNWRFGTSDTWGGFLAERAIVLRAMQAAEHRFGVRVVVLSGDRHEFAAVRFPCPVANVNVTTATEDGDGDGGRQDGKVKVQYDETPDAGPHEFSVGPLSMFYLPVRTFRQVDGGDVRIEYVPDGNSKVGVVEIQGGAEGGGGVLRYTLWVDGERRWEYELRSAGRRKGGGGRGGGGAFWG